MVCKIRRAGMGVTVHGERVDVQGKGERRRHRYNKRWSEREEEPMSSIRMKGVIRNGRVEVAAPIDLPDGSEVTIIADGPHDRPMTSTEIAATLAAMSKVEPFDMTDEERASADAWAEPDYS
jgi:hypothetical protein